MINWRLIAVNLQEHIPLERASRELGMGEKWLSNIKRRKQIEPGFDAGIRLLRMHARLCGHERHLTVIKRGKL